MIIVCSVIVLYINGCDKTTGPTGPSLSNGLSSNRTTFSLRLLQEDTCSISGGTGRYVVSSKPDSTVVEYDFFLSKLRVRAMSAGYTSITISDDSNHSVIIPINVVVPPGKISFESTEGSFSANGSIDVEILAGEGCGALGYKLNNKLQFALILGYKFYSANDAGIVLISLNDTAGVTARHYTIGKNLTVEYIPHGMNTSTVTSYDSLTSGSISISLLTDENIKGTFSGNGKNTTTGQAISITNGSFDCPLFAEEIYITTNSIPSKNPLTRLYQFRK